MRPFVACIMIGRYLKMCWYGESVLLWLYIAAYIYIRSVCSAGPAEVYLGAWYAARKALMPGGMLISYCPPQMICSAYVQASQIYISVRLCRYCSASGLFSTYPSVNRYTQMNIIYTSIVHNTVIRIVLCVWGCHYYQYIYSTLSFIFDIHQCNRSSK